MYLARGIIGIMLIACNFTKEKGSLHKKEGSKSRNQFYVDMVKEVRTLVPQLLQRVILQKSHADKSWSNLNRRLSGHPGPRDFLPPYGQGNGQILCAFNNGSTAAIVLGPPLFQPIFTPDETGIGIGPNNSF